jgi:hypothetical protein
MALSKAEGLRCHRSLLSFDRLTILSEVEGLAAYDLYASVGAPRRLASNTLPVARVAPKSTAIADQMEI